MFYGNFRTKEKSIATVASLYPGGAYLMIPDTKQSLITNQLYKKGFGGFL